ncbi:MAG: DUF5716 family protein [Lachnospiraceae bacterium]|nr:DUF5716 family protein [Lachnospiraceae bacterium]
MSMMQDIPDRFWSLFRSVNREIYIEALLTLNEEYQYNNYFLSRDVCIQVLSDFYTKKRLVLWHEEDEDELELTETPANRILNWLLKAGWLRKQDDFLTLTVNIVIPDYAAVFIEAFERLSGEDTEETDIYIQNVYATLFSFNNDPKAGIGMLRTALVNTRKLNKALQDMLHNMDKFFGSLLKKDSYGDLLEEHLNGYVEEIVRKKYHILKTSDNFYIYKNDIKKCIRDMREDPRFDGRDGRYDSGEVQELLDAIDRGFDDIEHRIANMDREHTKYVRTTVTKLNYLLNREEDMKGLLIQLMTAMAAEGKTQERLGLAAECMNYSNLEILSEKSLYKRRRPKKDFLSQIEERREEPELSMEEVLRLNRIQYRYSRKEIEAFIEERMENGRAEITERSVQNEEDFEKLILAYDYSVRRDSRYRAEETGKRICANGYSYPALIFYPKTAGGKEKLHD